MMLLEFTRFPLSDGRWPLWVRITKQRCNAFVASPVMCQDLCGWSLIYLYLTEKPPPALFPIQDQRKRVDYVGEHLPWFMREGREGSRLTKRWGPLKYAWVAPAVYKTNRILTKHVEPENHHSASRWKILSFTNMTFLSELKNMKYALFKNACVYKNSKTTVILKFIAHFET